MQSSTAIAAALRRVADYLDREPTDFIYYSHKTEEEAKAAQNAKRRRVRAQRKAGAVIKSGGGNE